MIKVGSAQVNITPPVGSRIIGQRLVRIAKGIHDELYASAIVIDNGIKRIAFVSCDVLSIGNRTIKVIREEVARETSIPEEHLFISATHTHTGPAVASALGTNVDETYRKQFIKYVAGAVLMANERLVDAVVGMGSVDAPGWTFPRRYWMKDGTVRMHPGKTDPNIVKPEGIADTELGVLFAKNASGQVIAMLVNYSSHSTVVGGDVYISADYPGYIRRTIKKVAGDETVVLFGNGACGDTCPTNVENPKRSEHGHEWADRMGLALGARAISLMAEIDPQDSLEIDVRRQIIDIPIREIPEEDLRQAEAIFAEESVTEQPTDVQKTWSRELILLNRDKQKDTSAHAEIMAIRLGNGMIVGVPSEFFASLGLQIKKSSRWNPTLIIELANGCVGYIPTAEAFKGGGYETELARSSKLIPSAGEIIVETVGNLLANI